MGSSGPVVQRARCSRLRDRPAGGADGAGGNDMSGSSSIEWTDATWNPVRGCSRVSEGCRNCYAERQAARFAEFSPISEDRGEGGISHAERRGPFFGFAEHASAGPRWTGRVELIPEKLD